MSLPGQNHWFIRNVIWWRAAASIAWSVLLLPVTTALFVLFSKVSLLHPIQWISESVSLLYGSYVIFSLLMLTGVLLVVGFFNLQYYTVVASIPCTKIALLGKVLHPQQFVHSLVHCTLGMIVAWCASVMIGGRYNYLAYPCSEDESGAIHQMCLNEHHLFFLLAGAFIGYSYSLLGVVRNMNYISFHTVQQYKYLRFKGALPLVVKYSAVESLYLLRNFCILYFFLGYVPRAWICTTMNLHKDSSVNALDTVTGLLDLSLLYHLWISGAFLLATWYTTMLLFKIYISEMYSFPVQSAFSEEASECLPTVISSKTPLILKFLALQDLSLLSQHSPSRRQEVFSLSQPGGHPHNWSAICKESLSLIHDLTQRLVAYHEAVSSNGRAKSQSSDKEHKSTTSESSAASGLEELAKTPWRLAGAQDPFSPWYGSVQSPHVTRRAPKLWSSSTVTESPLSVTPLASPAIAPTPAPPAQTPGFLSLWLQSRQEQVKNFLAKRVLIMYLFSKLPEASSQALFADSQAHIWALEGLSHLIAASYTEDRFGVVQTTFSSILSSMLTLQEAVDKHFKLPHASSKPGRSSFSMEDTTYKTLRFALRAALKTAIYRITSTFGQHIHAVQMTTEHRKRLQQFMEYKEAARSSLINECFSIGNPGSEASSGERHRARPVTDKPFVRSHILRMDSTVRGQHSWDMRGTVKAPSRHTMERSSTAVKEVPMAGPQLTRRPSKPPLDRTQERGVISLKGLLAAQRFSKGLQERVALKRAAQKGLRAPTLKPVILVKEKIPAGSAQPSEHFPCAHVNLLLQRFLSSRLEGAIYDASCSNQLVQKLSEDLKRLVRAVCPPRYKLVCMLTLGQAESEGAILASRCLWDPHSDTFTSYSYKSPHVFCTAVVFAVYCE
ncbi:hypothetical protein AGOR_G00177180 [Albula goreensis]|uniref:Nucleoporin NDC1 n=1 Tax=Albula goreensis TaxID=1534307 RepID=A0A8T3D0L7_9TELE|nr:hypothetical protein AGOR_G00177180 [Albula goreensis]